MRLITCRMRSVSDLLLAIGSDDERASNGARWWLWVNQREGEGKLVVAALGIPRVYLFILTQIAAGDFAH